MSYVVKGKVALVTGGASGIGLCIAKELLKNGTKGVVVSDIDEANGQKCAEQLNTEYGSNKAVFVKTDVTNRKDFENAFRETLRHFNCIDILVNGAGIVNETENWDKMISININGVIHGVQLGMEEFLKNHKQGSEGLIVNVASIAGIGKWTTAPIYSATKAAVVALTRSLGAPIHFEATKVKVIGICPGITRTPIFVKAQFHPRAAAMAVSAMNQPYQGPEFVAEEAVKVLQDAENGSIWVIDRHTPAYQFKEFFEIDTK